MTGFFPGVFNGLYEGSDPLCAGGIVAHGKSGISGKNSKLSVVLIYDIMSRNQVSVPACATKNIIDIRGTKVC